MFMYRKMVLLCMVGAMFAAGVANCAGLLINLSDDMHILGPKLTEKELEGKVVFIEFWGRRCGPCIASLPKMQEMYAKYAKRGNFMLIGSHCQAPDNEKVQDLLNKVGVTYPVYQYLLVKGMPEFSGIPHAAIIDHKGKFVASGGLGEMLAELPKVLKAAPIPIPGSLLGSLEVVHNKGVEKVLVFGRNVEPMVAQLAAKANEDSEAGKEAAAIVKAAETTLSAREAEIRVFLENAPSMAHAAIAELSKTSPSRAAQFSEAYSKLNASLDIPKLRMLRQEVEKMGEIKPANKSMARSAVQQTATKRRMYAALETNADAAIQAEGKALLAEFDAYVEEWGEIAGTAR